MNSVSQLLPSKREGRREEEEGRITGEELREEGGGREGGRRGDREGWRIEGREGWRIGGNEGWKIRGQEDREKEVVWDLE